MEISNFRESKHWTFESILTLWDAEVCIGIVLGEDTPDNKQALVEYLPDINEKLKWIRQSKSLIEGILIKEGMVSLAEDWVSGADPVPEERDKKCYMVEDGQKVCLPITREDFCRSLNLDGITVYCEEGIDHILMDIFLHCSPDYFAGHAINFMVKADNSVVVNGLCG